ncbi:MAG: polysaccharide deacetylase family protein [Clostridia bacterium]|nr:polysaccharide deacetylase family protein [Clostridia bacterium]
MGFKFLFPEGKKNALTFSYDDNQIYDRRLVGILNKNHLKGTFHLNSGTIGVQNEHDQFLNWDEIKDLYSGHEVACHGYHHPFFNQLTKGVLVEEILKDKETLEQVMGYPVRGMSYPFGCFSDEICDTARMLGIEYSRTVESTGNFNLPDDFLKWNPTCHHNADLQSLSETFLNPPSYASLQLFYIWGHSFEFEREHTWEMMEAFCEKVGQKDFVWYATNIEIKEYIEAARGLITTAKQDVIYNPSALDVYIEYQDEVKVIHPAQTVKL